MAPRHVLLVLAVAAAATSVLAASPVPTTAPMSGELQGGGEGEAAAATSVLAASPVPTTAPMSGELQGGSEGEAAAATRTVDDVFHGALPYLHTIIVRGTDDDPGRVYNVTFVFGTTRRVGTPRLEYAVVAAAADDEEQVSVAVEHMPLAVALLFFLVLLLLAAYDVIKGKGKGQKRSMLQQTKSGDARRGD